MSNGLPSYTAILRSITCFVRRLPLFFGKAPKTPLRVLCIIAFDTIHVCHKKKPLSTHQVRSMARFLDFGACTNAALDHKQLDCVEYHATGRQLETAGISTRVEEYVGEHRKREGKRPVPGGDDRRFVEVWEYRQTVARLLFEIAAEIALGKQCLRDGREASPWGDDIEILFRIVMQCQIIDDVLDYEQDLSAGLPSFVTAAASLHQSLEWTGQASRCYASHVGVSQANSLFPLRVALYAVSGLAQLVIRISLRRIRRKPPATPERVVLRSNGSINGGRIPNTF